MATQKDARGLVTGDVTAFSYVINPDGTRVTTTTAPVTSFEAAFNPTVVDTYDPHGWLVQRVTRPSTTDMLTWTFAYDALGNKTSEIDSRGNRTDYCYDTDFAGTAVPGSVGNVTRVIGPPPTAGASRPVALTAFDAKTNVTQTVAPNGVPSGAVVTCSTNLASITVAHATDFTFDAGGVFLLSRTGRFTDPDTGLKTAVTKFEYGDAVNPGRVTRVIPARGNTAASPDYTFATVFTYYGAGLTAGLLKDVTNALGNRSTYNYDPVGRVTSSIDPLGDPSVGGYGPYHATVFTYDKEDRLRTHSLPSPLNGGTPLVSETRYDEMGNPTVRIDANGQVTTYRYDLRNSLDRVQESPLTWTNPASPPAQVITTEYARDAGGNPTRVLRAAGDAASERAVDFVYDGRGLPMSEKQYPNWPATTGPLTTTFRYDAIGNATSVVDALGQTLTVGYDNLNRRTSLDYSDLGTPDVTFAFDASGNRTGMTDGTGTTTYILDEANRVVTVASPGPATVSYRYDLDGHRTKLTYPDATSVTYAFNKAGQLASLMDWATRTVTYTYWRDGRVKAASYPNGTQTTYGYDNTRRLVDIAHRGPTAQLLDRSFYTFDAVGNVTAVNHGLFPSQFARPDGLASSNGTWGGAFSSMNEVVANDSNFLASPSSPVSPNYYEVSLSDVQAPMDLTNVTFRFRVAKSGNNSGQTIALDIELRQGSTVIFTAGYQGLPGVTGSGWVAGAATLSHERAVTITNYADLRLRFTPRSSGSGQARKAQISWAEVELPSRPDPAKATSYGYDRLYRLTSTTDAAGTRTYAYDAAGNRLMRVAGTTTTYSYDRADRMTAAGAIAVTIDANGNLTAKGSDVFAYDQANRLKTATIGGSSETYGYNGDGVRISRQIGAQPAIPFVVDHSGSLATLLTDGTRKYVYGLGLAYAVAGSAIEVYHADSLSSVRALTNGTGSVTATYETDEWGRPTGATGSSAQPFRYSSEFEDR